MKTLYTNQLPASGMGRTDFESAKAFACSVAASSGEFVEPELVAWYDCLTARESPVMEGCSDEYAWHDYGVSHGGKLEVDVDNKRIFIFAESARFESYPQLGKSPLRNLHDAKGNELLCHIGGGCIALSE